MLSSDGDTHHDTAAQPEKHFVFVEGLFPQWGESDRAQESASLSLACRVAGPLRRLSLRTKPQEGPHLVWFQLIGGTAEVLREAGDAV
jgi:hypothetical protein